MNVILLLASFHTDEGLSPDGRERVIEAATMLREDSSSKVVITGGELAYGVAGPHHAYVEAELAREGIDAQRVLARLVDTAHTADEAAQTSSLLQSVHYAKLTIVTSLVHYPRAPFVFAHFFDFARLTFVFVPDKSAKDVTRFNYLHEMEAYHEDRKRGGLLLRDGSFIRTNFDYAPFANFLKDNTQIRAPEMHEHELEITSEMNLFEFYTPNSPFVHEIK